MDLDKIADKILHKINNNSLELREFIINCIKEEIQNSKYIIVYPEDEGWEEFCEILHVSKEASSLTIYVADYDYEFDEEDDYNIDDITDKIECLEFSVYKDEDYIEISDTSPCGQDCSITIELEKLEENSISEIIFTIQDDFDPDYEASLWIGDDGHGANGAPYNIKDIVEDMEWWRDRLKELAIDLDRAGY